MNATGYLSHNARELLDALGRIAEPDGSLPSSLREVARRAGMPMARAYRGMDVLRTKGYVTRSTKNGTTVHTLAPSLRTSGKALDDNHHSA